jgi:hypothetical protein
LAIFVRPFGSRKKLYYVDRSGMDEVRTSAFSDGARQMSPELLHLQLTGKVDRDGDLLDRKEMKI